MANKKITALTAITALDVADVLPVADVSIPETKKITAANLWLGGFNAHKDIDGTFAANSDLVFPTQKAAKTYVDTAAAAKISDTAFGAGWNAVTTIAPSKNAVYDAFQLYLPLAGGTMSGNLTLSGLTASLPVFTDASKNLESKSIADTLTALGVSAFVKTLLDDTSAKAARATLDAMPAGAYELTDGATIAIDWDNGATQYVVLGATGRTVTFANPVNGAVYRFIIIQDDSGSQTITTWPTIKWAIGVAPTLSTTAAYIDIVTLLYCNGVYYGDILTDFRTPA